MIFGISQLVNSAPPCMLTTLHRLDGTTDFVSAPGVIFVRTAIGVTVTVTVTDPHPPTGSSFYRFEALFHPFPRNLRFTALPFVKICKSFGHFLIKPTKFKTKYARYFVKHALNALTNVPCKRSGCHYGHLVHHYLNFVCSFLKNVQYHLRPAYYHSHLL